MPPTSSVQKEQHLITWTTTAVKYGIKKIEDRLDFKKVNGFFNSMGTRWYNQDELDKAGITDEEIRDYADLALGKKILKHLVENGDCHFTAEC